MLRDPSAHYANSLKQWGLREAGGRRCCEPIGKSPSDRVNSSLRFKRGERQVAIEPGQQLLHYRIDRKIGEGGMGEVWAATDTRLNRAAAIKALPASVVGDAERLARFKREAQLLAALSHPNIAAIFGLEEMEGSPYLAMELVEGDDLSTRIDGRSLPVDEAVEIALQIAAALEEAHDKGIVHRDLKPANVKVTADGKVKVLDFGLAKALSIDPEGSSGSFDPSRSPTMTAAMGTQAGLILGTAAYMAPEQARGKTVDRRADIWAFGVILFEMLTGERMYAGETVTDIIAAVVTREPDWNKLPADTPVALRRVLKRCLQRDPRKRLRDIGDAALELTDEPEVEIAAPSAPPATPSPRGRRWLALVGLAGLALGFAAAVTIWSVMGSAESVPSATWSNLPPPDGHRYDFTRFLEISPNGRHVVFIAEAPDSDEPMLWVRDLDAEQPRPLIGTEGARQPFWSPDSEFIGYFAGRKLRRIGVAGGVSTALTDAGMSPRGGSWGVDGTILFVPDWSEPLFRVSESGGKPEPVTQFDAERLELSHRWPHMLPDGQHFLFFVVSTYPELNPENPTEADKSGLYLGSLDGTEPRLLQTARSRVAYTNGSLVFVDDGILMARPFDVESLSFLGDPVALAEGITQTVDALWGGALFSVSDEGTLLFVRGAPERRAISQLRWRDRQGREVGTFGESQSYNSLRLSHDGRRVATSIGDPGDIWVHDLERESTARFTFDPGNDIVPVWSPGDDRIVFGSSRVIPGKPFSPGNLFEKTTDGLEPEEHLAVVDVVSTLLPADSAPDGSLVVLTALHPGTGADIMTFSFANNVIEPYLKTEDDEQAPRLSPNGRWIAYESNESGRYEIYVQAFPGTGGKWQVSSGGGNLPAWREDGKELFYLGPEGLMVVPVETAGSFRNDTPVNLFTLDVNITPDGYYNYDVSPDGQRFLFLGPVEGASEETGMVTLVQQWRALQE